MAKNKKKNSNNNGETVAEVKKKGGDGGGKEEEKNSTTVVLKLDMHCEGCASKILKIARGFDGVETARAEVDSNKLTVTGKVDPSEIRENLHHKTKKKVDLISPQPKKEDAKPDSKDEKKPNDKKPDADKKPKEPPVTTAVLKLAFHCQGCIGKIYRIVSKTKGIQEMQVDKQKETVTVKGTMDVKALSEALKERLKRPVEIVPPKKEKDGGGGEKGGDDAGGGGGKKGGDGSGGKKKGGEGGGGQDRAGGGDAGKMEGNRMEYVMQPAGFGPAYGNGYIGQPVYGNGYMGQPVYGPGYMDRPVYGNGYMGQPVHAYGQDWYGPGAVPGYPAHMRFNDENPNSCFIM